VARLQAPLNEMAHNPHMTTVVWSGIVNPARRSSRNAPETVTTLTSDVTKGVLVMGTTYETRRGLSSELSIRHAGTRAVNAFMAGYTQASRKGVPGPVAARFGGINSVERAMVDTNSEQAIGKGRTLAASILAVCVDRKEHTATIVSAGTGAIAELRYKSRPLNLSAPVPALPISGELRPADNDIYEELTIPDTGLILALTTDAARVGLTGMLNYGGHPNSPIEPFREADHILRKAQSQAYDEYGTDMAAVVASLQPNR